MAIQRLNPDELPVPPPPGFTRSVYQPFFGTPMGGLPSAPIPVTLPNDLDLNLGDKAEMWYYDAAPFPGVPGAWRFAGMATVSQDGATIASDPGVGIQRFCGVCGLVSCIVPFQATQPTRNSCSPKAGKPVDLFLGQEILENADVVAMHDPLGRETRFEYDTAGNVTQIIDPAGNVRHFEYEPTFNRLTKFTDVLGSITTFTYDARGNLTSITDPLKQVTQIASNAFGQPTSMTDPLGQVTPSPMMPRGTLRQSPIRWGTPLHGPTTRFHGSLRRPIRWAGPHTLPTPSCSPEPSPGGEPSGPDGLGPSEPTIIRINPDGKPPKSSRPRIYCPACQRGIGGTRG